MTDFSRSYTSKWKIVKVDVDTWDDAEIVNGVSSVKVNRDCTDDVPLLETGSFEMVSQSSSDAFEGWYRIIVTTNRNGIFERCPIATLLFQKADETLDFQRSTTSLNGYSVLKPLEDRKNIGEDYRYVPKGENGPEWVLELVKSTTPAPVTMIGSGFTVDNPIVFSPGVSYLSMAWTVLSKKKWIMQIDGTGAITILEMPKEPCYSLDRTNVRHIRNGLKRSVDLASIPNRYYAIDRDGTIEVAENMLENSRTSYQARGRWIDYVDTSPSTVNGETLYSYARRRLEEESTLLQQYSYSRAYIDGLFPFDVVEAKLPERGLYGDLRIISQAVSCGESVEVDETAVVEVKEWKA